MPKRKRYHKVWNGCLTCKERKVRCSLERPVCQNCSRLCRPCSYTKPSPEQNTEQLLFSRRSFQSTPVQEVELMHHYVTYTYSTFTNNPILVSLWKDAVPRHAFRHRFLLQGLLAVAAQHKVHYDKSERSPALLGTATFHQHEALASCIHLLNNLTEDNCHSIFAFSQVIVAISYSRLSLDIFDETRHPHEIIAGIVDIFDLLKGVLAIALHSQTWLRAGNLEPMMDIPKIPLPNDPSATRNPYIVALSKLSDHIAGEMNNGVDSRNRVESLLSTIQLLYTIFLEDSESPDKLNMVLGLPVFLDRNYLNLLKARDHASLTILAYYGIALHQIRHIWCFDRVGSGILQAVTDLVSCDWSTHLILPKLEIWDKALQS